MWELKIGIHLVKQDRIQTNETPFTQILIHSKFSHTFIIAASQSWIPIVCYKLDRTEQMRQKWMWFLDELQMPWALRHFG